MDLLLRSSDSPRPITMAHAIDTTASISVTGR